MRRPPGRGVPHQKRRGEGDRDLAGQPPRLVLRLEACRALQRGHQLPQAGHGGVEPRVGPGGGVHLGQQRVRRARGPGERPQHVERRHVARAFPDRVQRGLPVQPGQAGLLDVPVAAQALQRLHSVRGEPLAQPVLGGGQGQPQERGLARVTARGPVRRTGQPDRHGRGRLGFHGQVSEHVGHQRLGDELFAERLAVAGVVHRRDRRGAHARRTADHAVEPGRAHHGDDRGHAPASRADLPGQRVIELHLGGGVGPVAELVLQPLQAHPVPLSAGQHPGEQEAGEAVRALGQGEEQVRHGRGAEPLVPGQHVRPGPGTGGGLGAGGVGPHVAAALLLGHGHAGQQAALAFGRAQAWVVGPGDQQRLEPARQFRCVPQGGYHRVGHRDGAAVARLCLGPYVELRGPGHVGARPLVRPRCRVQPVADRGLHQGVPGGVELDLVDPVAVPVVAAQHRRVLVGQPGLLLRVRAAGQVPKLVQFPGGPPGAFPLDRLQQGRIGGHVVAGQRRHLVADLMGSVRARHAHRVLPSTDSIPELYEPSGRNARRQPHRGVPGRRGAPGGRPPGPALRATAKPPRGGKQRRPRRRGAPGGRPPGPALRATAKPPRGGEQRRPPRPPGLTLRP